MFRRVEQGKCPISVFIRHYYRRVDVSESLRRCENTVYETLNETQKAYVSKGKLTETWGK